MKKPKFLKALEGFQILAFSRETGVLSFYLGEVVGYAVQCDDG